MKSNKWKFLLTGAATLTLLTACSQASSQSATTNATTTASSVSKKTTKPSNLTILPKKIQTPHMMKVKHLLSNYLARLQLFQGMA